ncbi:HPr family phosphocarrier protein [Thermococcus paralvinellae]|uniref:Phosphotransferase system, phosphocarrier protein HPr n=1 Tax=Thermococcus paralvinellae TaxID=582419 RepID=W0I6L5_9EURY|nr:HPr family phosphocarrier protein [Thermococcus paralvinellae]AHF80085.1 Phosphotransferase system, phosphocarrier protein HPr [Thermococcus paralvinellae]
MIEKRVEIKNKSGLHARPAAVFVETTKKFKSKITVIKEGKSADAKNILQILALGVDYGDEIVLQISGEDEEEAARELIDLLERVLPSEDK